jgi:hypothetical protein
VRILGLSKSVHAENRLSLRAKFLVGGVLFFGVLFATMALGVMETVEIIDQRIGPGGMIDPSERALSLMGWSMPRELNQTVEKPPISREEALEMGCKLVSFLSEPKVELREAGSSLTWRIGTPPTASITIDARKGEVLHVIDHNGLSFAQGLKGSRKDVSIQVLDRLGWPKGGIELVEPKDDGDTIWWSHELREIRVDALAYVAFDGNLPVSAGHTWLVLDDSASKPVTPKTSQDEAERIGREELIELGFALDTCKSSSQLIWYRPLDFKTFGYKYRLTWATSHENPSPQPKGIPSKAYAYVDALTGNVTGIDYVD